MKKFLILFLSVTLLLLCSCGDSKADDSNTGDGSSGTSDGAAAQNKTAILKTEKIFYTTDVKKIAFQIYNYGNDEISFPSDAYNLEIKKGGKWQTVPYKSNDINFELFAESIGPSELWEAELDLEKLYDLPLTKGTYRIANENAIDKTDSFEFEIR